MSTPVDESGIRPCQGCGRMTRPRDTPARGAQDNEALGTVPRIESKYCSPCYTKFSPSAEAARERDAQRREKEKAQRLQAAFNARDELAAARQARLDRALQRQMGAAVLARTQRRVSV